MTRNNKSNFVNIGAIKNKSGRMESKMKDRMVMLIGGIAIFIITFFIYGFIEDPENNLNIQKIETDNRDILAQINRLEEQKKIREEKVGKIRDEIFLGKNTPIDKYTESLINDLKKRAGTKDIIEYFPVTVENKGNEEWKHEAGYNIDEILSHLKKDPETSRNIFSESEKGRKNISRHVKQSANSRKISSLFAFSNNIRTARTFNNGYENIINSSVMDHKNLSEKGVTENNASKQTTKLIYNLNPVFKIFEGEFLEATLVNRIVNNRGASPVTAIISKDLLEKNGEFVLIPSNSKLVGEAGKIANQQDVRLMIKFHRLILPNGRSIRFGVGNNRLIALDRMGSLGIKGRKNSHFFSKFGSSLLYGSLNGLSGFAQNRIKQSSGISYFLDRTSDNFETINDRLASDSLSILPTITIEAGTELKIHVSRDIEISAYRKTSERSYY